MGGERHGGRKRSAQSSPPTTLQMSSLRNDRGERSRFGTAVCDTGPVRRFRDGFRETRLRTAIITTEINCRRPLRHDWYRAAIVLLQLLSAYVRRAGIVIRGAIESAVVLYDLRHSRLHDLCLRSLSIDVPSVKDAWTLRVTTTLSYGAGETGRVTGSTFGKVEEKRDDRPVLHSRRATRTDFARDGRLLLGSSSSLARRDGLCAAK